MWEALWDGEGGPLLSALQQGAQATLGHPGASRSSCRGSSGLRSRCCLSPGLRGPWESNFGGEHPRGAESIGCQRERLLLWSAGACWPGRSRPLQDPTWRVAGEASSRVACPFSSAPLCWRDCLWSDKLTAPLAWLLDPGLRPRLSAFMCQKSAYVTRSNCRSFSGPTPQGALASPGPGDSRLCTHLSPATSL